MLKGIKRARDLSKPPISQKEVKRKLKDAKRDLRFTLRRFWSLRKKNPLLFWGSAATLITLLGATVALLTPFLSAPILDQRQQFLLRSKHGGNYISDQQLSRPVNILVMGIDPPSGFQDTSPEVFTGPSDTMLLLRLDPDNKLLRVLSIPKDSQVVIPDIGLAKISTANSIGGPALAARVVSSNLNNVPIDRYVRITTSAFQELVSLVGGVEVFVPQPMVYKDAAGQLEINIEPGWQTLNGEQAEKFARFRDSQVGDLTRIQRQQELLKSLRDRLTSPTVLPRLPELMRMTRSYIDTNLSVEEIMALVDFGIELEPQNLQMMLLPGNLSPLSRDPSSYWLDSERRNWIMSEYFDVQAIGSQGLRSLTSMKIAVQNASKDPYLGRRVAKYLTEKGFDNVYVISDWPDAQRQTEIIAQQGNQKAAAELQQVLGLGKIEPTATGDLKSHLTIRVGKDWIERQNRHEH